MLKPYSELRKIDVSKHCDSRKANDDNGKTIDVAYLNWAKCIDLLHENGAEVVYYVPLTDPNGSFVFCHYDVTKSSTKNGRAVERRTQCFFVKVEIHIDDKVYVVDYPLMNGTYVVYEDTIDQLRVSNAHARAFVKGVAIHTGLGFGLWSDGTEDAPVDDLSAHNILAIKRRVEELATAKLQGMAYGDILDALQIKDKDFKALMGMFERLNNFEKALARV